jgi:hypothetical protein
VVSTPFSYGAEHAQPQASSSIASDTPTSIGLGDFLGDVTLERTPFGLFGGTSVLRQQGSVSEGSSSAQNGW